MYTHTEAKNDDVYRICEGVRLSSALIVEHPSGQF